MNFTKIVLPSGDYTTTGVFGTASLCHNVAVDRVIIAYHASIVSNYVLYMCFGINKHVVEYLPS